MLNQATRRASPLLPEPLGLCRRRCQNRWERKVSHRNQGVSYIFSLPHSIFKHEINNVEILGNLFIQIRAAEMQHVFLGTSVFTKLCIWAPWCRRSYVHWLHNACSTVLPGHSTLLTEQGKTCVASILLVIYLFNKYWLNTRCQVL